MKLTIICIVAALFSGCAEENRSDLRTQTEPDTKQSSNNTINKAVKMDPGLMASIVEHQKDLNLRIKPENVQQTPSEFDISGNDGSEDSEKLPFPQVDSDSLGIVGEASSLVNHFEDDQNRGRCVLRLGFNNSSANTACFRALNANTWYDITDTLGSGYSSQSCFSRVLYRLNECHQGINQNSVSRVTGSSIPRSSGNEGRIQISYTGSVNGVTRSLSHETFAWTMCRFQWHIGSRVDERQRDVWGEVHYNSHISKEACAWRTKSTYIYNTNANNGRLNSWFGVPSSYNTEKARESTTTPRRRGLISPYKGVLLGSIGPKKVPVLSCSLG